MKIWTIILSWLVLISCTAQQTGKSNPEKKTKLDLAVQEVDPVEAELGEYAYFHVIPDSLEKIEPSVANWKDKLAAAEYNILFEKGTERPFTGDLLGNKKKGTYVCAACKLPLFYSDHKFKSGTGWPSFYQPVEAGHVAVELDKSYGMTRVEVLCARCNGHLGHVFKDGPEPTNLRYCINSLALDFEKD